MPKVDRDASKSRLDYLVVHPARIVCNLNFGVGVWKSFHDWDFNVVEQGSADAIRHTNVHHLHRELQRATIVLFVFNHSGSATTLAGAWLAGAWLAGAWLAGAWLSALHQNK